MNEFYRFQVFATRNLSEGRGARSIVGASYLKEGHRVYTLKLWMFPDSKFYLIPDKEDQSKVSIFTREPKRNPNLGKGKYFWNLIGSGFVDVPNEVVRLEFDLFLKPIYMSIFPLRATEASPQEFAEIVDAS